MKKKKKIQNSETISCIFDPAAHICNLCTHEHLYLSVRKGDKTGFVLTLCLCAQGLAKRTRLNLLGSEQPPSCQQVSPVHNSRPQQLFFFHGTRFKMSRMFAESSRWRQPKRTCRYDIMCRDFYSPAAQNDINKQNCGRLMKLINPNNSTAPPPDF